jgi:hypothetical protein
MNQSLDNCRIPTESFPLANGNILALVLGGQLTTDHLMGLSSFFAPSKECGNLLQGTRLRLESDGFIAECFDGEESTTILERGYVGDTGGVRILWEQHGFEVEDIYFVPPSLDIVVQKTRVRNTTASARTANLTAIIYPQLGSEVHHKKGICREARFDGASGAILIEDMKQNVLTFAFDISPESFQVGEVCGRTDVYYDLEDGKLSGHACVEAVVPNAALAVSWHLPPGAEQTIHLCLGRSPDQAAAVELVEAFRRRGPAALWEEMTSRSAVILKKSPVAAAPDGLDRRLEQIERRARLVLNDCLLPSGAPLGGFSCYHNVGQTRNSCYILLALDQLGYHDEVRRGYEYYVHFKVGDQRFASPDENDQLGTILHVFRRHADLSGDFDLWRTHRAALAGFADRLIALADPANGLIYSERAIHEFVAISRGYETYVNVMAWRGLADAADMEEALGDREQSARYRNAANRLRCAILEGLVDPDLGIFVKRVYLGRRVPLPAISMLTPALFGLIDPHDPVVGRTIDHLMKHIWDRQLGGLHRYPLHLQPWQEHPYGGPWMTYTSWLGRVHIMRGELEQAAELIRWALRNIPSDSNLIPEHFSAAHAGRRGFHRIYLDPSTPELWATAEFLRFAQCYRAALESRRAGPSPAC